MKITKIITMLSGNSTGLFQTIETLILNAKIYIPLEMITTMIE